ncbi:sugar transferase [Anaerococcus tetradius]|uniref:sugar transferase n=1 Tax=Anaerococcus tetradius TaxID=33036 RepID=UPI0023F040EA|nr:sugar transferase [Anaerococcus tetradius]
MRCEEVREYYNILYKKRFSILIKRIFDYILGILLLIVLAIPMIIIAVMIKLDSPGPVFYRQERVTRYGKHFRIHKFRTMVDNAENMGSAVTTENDSRVTKLGGKIRDYRLDELPQVIDVLLGDMSFVGTRPEAVKYVSKYKPEYYATLLLPAGITSEASIKYKDEAKLLMSAENIDKVYIEDVLQQKMLYNLKNINEFNFFNDLKIMFKTVTAVMR